MGSNAELIAAIKRRMLGPRAPSPTKIEQPASVEKRYAQEVVGIIVSQGLRDIAIVSKVFREVIDSPSSLWRRIERLLKEDLDSEVAAILPAAREAAIGINASNQAQVQLSIGELALPPISKSLERATALFLRNSLRYIKKTRRAAAKEYTDIALEHFRSGRDAGTLQIALLKRLSVSQSRARLIAIDQSGKFFGALTEIRHRSLGSAKYIWRTSRDERVRPTHAARDGQTFSYSDPPSDGNPGQAVLCRCTASPVF